MIGFRFQNPTAIAAPAELVLLISNGQSLSTAVGSVPAAGGFPDAIVASPLGTWILHDSTGNYTLSAPNAATLSMVPAINPVRPVNGSSLTAEYPDNIGQAIGGTGEIAMADMMRQILGWTFATSCTGQGGAPMAVIKQGGAGNAFAAGVYEAQAFAPASGSNPSGGGLAAGRGFRSVALGLEVWTHGETDSEFIANSGSDPTTVYQTPLLAQPPAYQSTIGAFTTPLPSWLPHAPMVLSEPNASPPSYSGRCVVRDIMNSASQTTPDVFVMAGPKYPYPLNAAFGPYHKTDYRPMFEKFGQFAAKYFREHALARRDNRAVNPLAWRNLVMTAASISGASATVTVHNPSGTPLVFDTTTVPKPHQNFLSFWNGGFGFECWKDQRAITNVTQTTPVQVTTATPHGRTTGDPYIITGTNGASNLPTNANGQSWVTVLDATNMTLFVDPGLTTPVASGSAFSAGGSPAAVGCCPIPVANATIVNQTTIDLVLGSAPAPGTAFISYIQFTDAPATQFSGAVPERQGNVRDSDPFFALSLIKDTLTAGYVPAHWCNWLGGAVFGPM